MPSDLSDLALLQAMATNGEFDPNISLAVLIEKSVIRMLSQPKTSYSPTVE